MQLTTSEEKILDGAQGAGAAMAMRVVTAAARMLDAPRLVEISSSHIDGCLYHGEGGLAFAEQLLAGGATVSVPTTLNVGATDACHPGRVRLSPADEAGPQRMKQIYEQLGCAPTWTCAPYQAGHRPAFGSQIAWGESNAVVFANSVLGARTNRYGDLLDICCAIVGRAPFTDLHTDDARFPTVLVDTGAIPETLKRRDDFYPVLGAWLGASVADRVSELQGLPSDVTEDQLKALGAAAASSGSVGLFHVQGVTPEACAAGADWHDHVIQRITLDMASLQKARRQLSTYGGGDLAAVALGSPHFSRQEIQRLALLTRGRTYRRPVYVCTRRDLISELRDQPELGELLSCGVEIVTDTCVVVAPILPENMTGAVMTNSGKFAHYTPANTGYPVVYGSLSECVESAVAGEVLRDDDGWQ